MRLTRQIRHSHSRSRSTARGYRDLARALAAAPTRASQEELLNLTNMGR